MKKYITFIALFIVWMSYGQTTIKKSSISTGGGTATAGTRVIIFTLGETAVQEQTQGSKHLSEGFIGPYILSALEIQDYIHLDGVNLYPNPTRDIINISINEVGNYEYHLFDMTGKELLVKTSSEIQESISLDNLSAGIYMLAIIERSKRKAITLKIDKL